MKTGLHLSKLSWKQKWSNFWDTGYAYWPMVEAESWSPVWSAKQCL